MTFAKTQSVDIVDMLYMYKILTTEHTVQHFSEKVLHQCNHCLLSRLYGIFLVQSSSTEYSLFVIVKGTLMRD